MTEKKFRVALEHPDWDSEVKLPPVLPPKHSASCIPSHDFERALNIARKVFRKSTEFDLRNKVLHLFQFNLPEPNRLYYDLHYHKMIIEYYDALAKFKTENPALYKSLCTAWKNKPKIIKKFKGLSEDKEDDGKQKQDNQVKLPQKRKLSNSAPASSEKPSKKKKSEK
eukprot:TRINITY_DN6752_c0_g1_i1.p1 TRINITY_DN6752_c0_g1~~TRINITY_DN6752_c0_g1_i1.p1  ORF type:complete len:168 (+),score=37.74 TRINITY_DN6752_c0_g1_i1:75-578(+)